MSKVSTNIVVGALRILSGVIGSTTDSDSVGSSPTRVVLKPNSLKKRDMRKEDNNSEPDPFKSQDLRVGFTQRKIEHDLKSCVYGYCKVSSGRPEAFC